MDISTFVMISAFSNVGRVMSPAPCGLLSYIFYLLSSIGFRISGLSPAKLLIRFTISLAGFDQRLWSSSIIFSFCSSGSCSKSSSPNTSFKSCSTNFLRGVKKGRCCPSFVPNHLLNPVASQIHQIPENISYRSSIKYPVTGIPKNSFNWLYRS